MRNLRSNGFGDLFAKLKVVSSFRHLPLQSVQDRTDCYSPAIHGAAQIFAHVNQPDRSSDLNSLMLF